MEQQMVTFRRDVTLTVFADIEFRSPKKRDSAVVILQRTHSTKTSDEELFDKLFRLFDMNGTCQDEPRYIFITVGQSSSLCQAEPAQYDVCGHISYLCQTEPTQHDVFGHISSLCQTEPT